MVDIKHPPSAYVSFVLCKAVFLSIVFFIPALVLAFPWWEVLIGALLMSFVSSCLFVYLLIGTHFSEETEFPETDDRGVIDGDWASHAMLTSLDWNPYSRVAHFVSGGANAHAAHHLFPNVSHRHYQDLTRIVVATAGEFGVPYRVTTFPKMIRSHFQFLKRMGVAEKAPRVPAA